MPQGSTTTARHPGALSAPFRFARAALPDSHVRGALAPLSSRLTGFTDTQGNQVQYTYDAMSRVTQLTDHTSSSTTYAYDLRGGVTQIATPSGNTGYTHDSAGRVSTRTYANNIKTSYTYDPTGRVSQMKFQDTNQQPPALLEQLARRRRVKLHYTGLNASYYRQETNAAARYTYTFDKLRRLAQEVKRGTGQGTPLHYQKDFAYDKAGNRLSYQHQNGGGYNYGLACNYNSYSYDAMGRLTQIRDTGRTFTATVTNDWNGNITQVGEVIPGTLNATSTFSYDYENRLTEYAIGGSGFSAEHTYDGFNRLIKTDATIGQNTQNFEHVYSHDLHIGSIEVTGTPVNGKVWRWGEGYGQEAIEAPQRYTASGVQYYQVNDERNAQRKTYRVASVTAGDYNDDSRYAEWQQVNGSVVPTRIALSTSLSELFSAYNLTLDADRAASAAASSALSLAATDLEYEGTRVKSAVMGRDLNPFGRGDGRYYATGGNPIGRKFFVYDAKPPLPIARSGFGSSVNNCGCGSGGCGAGAGPGAGGGGTIPPAGGGGSGGGSGAGGGGGGFGSFGCNVVRNRMIGTVCPAIGSGCALEICQEPGQPRWAFSCFDSCTYDQCLALRDFVIELDEDVYAECVYHGPAETSNSIALFVQAGGVTGVLSDCLQSGLCLTDCIRKVGREPCTITETSGVLGEDECPVDEIRKGIFNACRHMNSFCASMLPRTLYECLRALCKHQEDIIVECTDCDEGVKAKANIGSACNESGSYTGPGRIVVCYGWAAEMKKAGYPYWEWMGTMFHEMIHDCDCRTRSHATKKCTPKNKSQPFKETTAAVCAMECVNRGYETGHEIPKGCKCKDTW